MLQDKPARRSYAACQLHILLLLQCFLKRLFDWCAAGRQIFDVCFPESVRHQHRTSSGCPGLQGTSSTCASILSQQKVLSSRAVTQVTFQAWKDLGNMLRHQSAVTTSFSSNTAAAAVHYCEVLFKLGLPRASSIKQGPMRSRCDAHHAYWTAQPNEPTIWFNCTADLLQHSQHQALQLIDWKVGNLQNAGDKAAYAMGKEHFFFLR